MAKSYRNLIVWQKAMELVVAVYRVTEEFPEAERYGLISQMRRASVSIPSNIAEGYQRRSSKEFKQFLSIAFGSGAELETQVEISKRLQFTKDTTYAEVDAFLEEVMKLLNSATRKP